MANRSEAAMEKFKSGYNCAQAVFYVFHDELGIPEDTALKVSCGLGAGMGRKQEVCGAVTGGILVLGMRHGRGSNDERSAQDATYGKTKELIEAFAAKHGTCNCRELLDGCDLSSVTGLMQFKATGLLKKVCMPCVETVIQFLEADKAQ